MIAEPRRTRTKQQQLGVYYTPERIARLLTDWSIIRPTDTILDPSFGGCAFLYAALETLRARGAKEPGKQIYGVDIDPAAKDYLQPLFEAGAAGEQFLIKSFFDTLPIHYHFQTFDCVVGNPPYINYHHISKSEQKLALGLMKEAGVQVSARASSWAFFLIHSLQFLKLGGRLAMVLPSSFARADYAANVRKFLAQHFDHIYVIFLQERFFADTDEQAVLVLARDFGLHEGGDNFTVLEVDTIEQLCPLLQRLDSGDGNRTQSGAHENLYYGLIPSTTLTLLHTLQASNKIIKLGDWVNVRIGVVTGCNEFFIMNRSQQQSRSIADAYVQPIITRPARLKGLTLEECEVEQFLEQDRSSLLLTIEGDADLPESISTYINGAPGSVQNATKCKERKPWYSVLHHFSPPAFMPYMSAAWPRIIANRSVATCTNNIHRLSWATPRPAEDWQRLALGSISTLSQLSSELVGRSYGGGVLKLEPKEVLQLLVPIGEHLDNRLVQEVDRLLRAGNVASATDLVDQELLVKGLGMSSTSLTALRLARDHMHERRRG